jgi:hypothetical protein
VLETSNLNILDNDRRGNIMFLARTDIKNEIIKLPPDCIDRGCSKATRAVRVVAAVVDHFTSNPIEPIYNPNIVQQLDIENDVKTVIVKAVQKHCGKVVAKRVRKYLDDENIFGFQAEDSESRLSVEFTPRLQPGATKSIEQMLKIAS